MRLIRGESRSPVFLAARRRSITSATVGDDGAKNPSQLLQEQGGVAMTEEAECGRVGVEFRGSEVIYDARGRGRARLERALVGLGFEGVLDRERVARGGIPVAFGAGDAERGDGTVAGSDGQPEGGERVRSRENSSPVTCYHREVTRIRVVNINLLFSIG